MSSCIANWNEKKKKKKEEKNKFNFFNKSHGSCNQNMSILHGK